jgi:hypothetical protein
VALRKKKTDPQRSTGTKRLGVPSQSELKTRFQALSAFAARMQVDCSSDLEKAGDDPVRRIGVIAKALGLDALRAVNPATDLDELLPPKTR